MKYRTVTERIGERVGSVDWSYDFLKHFEGYNGCRPEDRAAACDLAVSTLRTLEAHHAEGDWWVTMPHSGAEFRVVAVGMYDGWPYWRPTPAVQYIGPLGFGEWLFFHDLRSARKRP